MKEEGRKEEQTLQYKSEPIFKDISVHSALSFSPNAYSHEEIVSFLFSFSQLILCTRDTLKTEQKTVVGFIRAGTRRQSKVKKEKREIKKLTNITICYLIGNIFLYKMDFVMEIVPLPLIF